MIIQRITGYIRGHTYSSLGFLFIISATLFFATSAGGMHLTMQAYDGIRVTDTRSEVVVIGIDDASLQTIGAWPFDRKVFAELTQTLDAAGVKVIVYDVLFLEPRTGDVAFAEALKHVRSTVILAAKIEHESYLPSFFVTSATPQVIASLSNVIPDVDGKVRLYPSPRIINNTCVYGLGEEAFRIATFEKYEGCLSRSDKHFRYPEKLTTYSLIDILSHKVNPELLKGKVVFIGSTALDLQDHFVGMSGEKIPGVYVHASIFTSLMNKEGDKALSFMWMMVLFIFFASLTVLLLNVIKTIGVQVATTSALLLSVFFISYLFFSNHIIIPLPWILLVIILTGGYSTLIRYVKEKKRSEHVQSLFSKYVHKDVLRELMKSPGALNLTGEKRYLTVLFSDLRGFTTLSELVSPEELTSVLNGYFSAMTPIVLDERGTVDKFIGDAVMAFWNAPLAVDHHEGHAVRAAIRMQHAITKFNEDNGYTLAAGIGIHAGDVIVGNVGSSERVNYTILGDTVNLASRVEGLTKKYGVGILVTDEVRNKIDDTTIMFRKLDVITVKGKTKPTVLYEAMEFSDTMQDIILDYDIAFTAYQKGDFDKAEVLFKALAERGDIPSHIMYERIMLLEKTGTWDGVWHWEEK